MAVDNEFNRFVDEFLWNFTKFLKLGKKLKSRPKVVSKDNMRRLYLKIILRMAWVDLRIPLDLFRKLRLADINLSLSERFLSSWNFF